MFSVPIAVLIAILKNCCNAEIISILMRKYGSANSKTFPTWPFVADRPRFESMLTIES